MFFAWCFSGWYKCHQRAVWSIRGCHVVSLVYINYVRWQSGLSCCIFGWYKWHQGAARSVRGVLCCIPVTGGKNLKYYIEIHWLPYTPEENAHFCHLHRTMLKCTILGQHKRLRLTNDKTTVIISGKSFQSWFLLKIHAGGNVYITFSSKSTEDAMSISPSPRNPRRRQC